MALSRVVSEIFNVETINVP